MFLRPKKIEKKLDENRIELKSDIASVLLEMRGEFNKINAKFSNLDSRFIKIDSKFSDIYSKFSKIVVVMPHYKIK